MPRKMFGQRNEWGLAVGPMWPYPQSAISITTTPGTMIIQTGTLPINDPETMVAKVKEMML